MRLPKAAELVEAKAHEALTYLVFPSNHRRQIKTNNPLERIIREIRRRTRVVGVFPDGYLALMLGRGAIATHREYEVGRLPPTKVRKTLENTFLQSDNPRLDGRSRPC
jgi:transposase-like protein